MSYLSHEHSHERELDPSGAGPQRHERSDQLHPQVHLQAVAQAGQVLGPAGLAAVQRTAGNAAAAQLAEEQLSPVLDVIGSTGNALDDATRHEMETRLGHDFSDVRVHTDADADASARSVNAHAYTVGSDIVFQRGAYDTGTAAGKTLLAHELTHVVQQRQGPVDGTPTAGGISLSDPADRFERAAAANADRVMAGPAPVQAALENLTTTTVDSVQRERAEDEDEQRS